MHFRSALDFAGLSWPAIVSHRGAQLLSLLYQFEKTERWPIELVRQQQQLQAEILIGHARLNSAYYSQRIPKGLVPLDSETWRELPCLTRLELQKNPDALRCANVPREHGRIFQTRTSGSTGEPVVVDRTEITQLIWEVLLLREHQWHGRDSSRPSAIIRANGVPAPGPGGIHVDGWGLPFDLIWQCGPSHLLDLTTDVSVQADWLRQCRPSYLLTYPTNLEALLEQLTANELELDQILCVGETVSEQLHRRVEKALSATLVANYSSQELGYIAVYCPQCKQYHVQSESVHVEVIGANDEPARSGEVGRVIVTDLHNFAMPLIRYEIGDYAEIGIPCPMRPGLLALRRILGRRRNMVVFPDGRRHWPLVGFSRFIEVGDIRQYQFIQRTRDDIDVRLVVDRPLSPDQLDELRKIVHLSLGYTFRLQFQQFSDRLPKTSGGKFEEFISLTE